MYGNLPVFIRLKRESSYPLHPTGQHFETDQAKKFVICQSQTLRIHVDRDVCVHTDRHIHMFTFCS